MIVLYVLLNAIGSYFFLGAILAIGRVEVQRKRKWAIAFLMSLTFRILLVAVPDFSIRLIVQLLIHWGIIYWIGQLSLRRSVAVILALFTVSIAGELLTLRALEGTVQNFDVLITLEAFYAFILVAYTGLASVCYLLAKRIATSLMREKHAVGIEVE